MTKNEISFLKELLSCHTVLPHLVIKSYRLFISKSIQICPSYNDKDISIYKTHQVPPSWGYIFLKNMVDHEKFFYCVSEEVTYLSVILPQCFLKGIGNWLSPSLPIFTSVCPICYLLFKPLGQIQLHLSTTFKNEVKKHILKVMKMQRSGIDTYGRVTKTKGNITYKAANMSALYQQIITRLQGTHKTI